MFTSTMMRVGSEDGKAGGGRGEEGGGVLRPCRNVSRNIYCSCLILLVPRSFTDGGDTRSKATTGLTLKRTEGGKEEVEFKTGIRNIRRMNHCFVHCNNTFSISAKNAN